MQIFKLDDGATYFIAAESQQDARAQWVSMNVEQGHYKDEASILEELDEPEITVVQPEDAGSVGIRDDDITELCGKCNGQGKIYGGERSLLECFQLGLKDKYGILGCSEY